MVKRAPLIVFEGLDRSGKSTQAGLLHARLLEAGIPCKLLKFPDRTTMIGKMIDAYLQSKAEVDDHAIHLLFSANRWELAATIEKLLAENTIVIADRYAFSGIAFSASKPTFDPSGSYEWLRAPDVSLPAPDLTLFFDLSPEQARLRGGYGQERYEKEEMQARVRKVFEKIGSEMGKSWNIIDASGSVEEVHGVVWNAVEPLTPGVSTPLHKLWVDS